VQAVIYGSIAAIISRVFAIFLKYFLRRKKIVTRKKDEKKEKVMEEIV
jgi:hypothetical protein